MNTQEFAGRDWEAEIIRFYELQMLSTASNFELWGENGRQKSAKALAKLFFGMTRVIKPHTFIEAGAKAADASLRVRTLCDDAEIFAYEANPYNFQQYMASQPFSERRVDYLNKAVSDRNGSVTFNIRKTVAGKSISPFTGQSSLLRRTDETTTYEEVTVECAMLDSEHPAYPRNTIWIDVEGATSALIEGGRGLLRNTQAAIVEVSDRQHWQGEWLSTRVIRELHQLGLVPVARDFEYRNQYNVVFVNRDIVDSAEIRYELAYFFSVLSR